MTLRRFCALPFAAGRPLSACLLLALGALACGGINAADGAGDGSFTSVPAGDDSDTGGSTSPTVQQPNDTAVGNGNGVAGSNGNDASPTTAGEGNTQLASSLARALTLALTNANNLCLTTSTNPPTQGATVSLTPCALVDAQNWWVDQGRLRVGANLCLANPRSNVNAASYTAGGNTVTPLLATCDSSDAHQRVELYFGNVVSMDGSNFWALTKRTGSATAATLVWAVLSNTDGSNDSSVENPNQDWSLVARLQQGANTVVGGFPIKLGGSANLCLDSNYRASSSSAAAVGTATCDGNAASQKWTSDTLGNLSNGGKCILVTGNAVSMAACVGGSVQQRWQTSLGAVILDANGYYLTVPSTTVAGAASMTAYTTQTWTMGWP